MNPNQETAINVHVSLRALEMVITAQVNGVIVEITNETPEPLRVLVALIEDCAFQHSERTYRRGQIEAFRKLLNLKEKRDSFYKTRQKARA